MRTHLSVSQKQSVDNKTRPTCFHWLTVYHAPEYVQPRYARGGRCYKLVAQLHNFDNANTDTYSSVRKHVDVCVSCLDLANSRKCHKVIYPVWMYEIYRFCVSLVPCLDSFEIVLWLFGVYFLLFYFPALCQISICAKMLICFAFVLFPTYRLFGMLYFFRTLMVYVFMYTKRLCQNNNGKHTVLCRKLLQRRENEWTWVNVHFAR